jgi:hypothetical protein
MRDALWRDGLPIVRHLTGLPDGKARGLLGSLLKSTNDDCAKVYRALREAEDLRPAVPVAWLKAACDEGRSQRRPSRVADAMAGIGFAPADDRGPVLELFPHERNAP